ncbi:MAG: hypothetical protein ABGZ17_24660, partial [Planctomycetaceae bacterium]
SGVFSVPPTYKRFVVIAGHSGNARVTSGQNANRVPRVRVTPGGPVGFVLNGFGYCGEFEIQNTHEKAG